MGDGQLPRAGALLREWRLRRKLSQLELALRADTSTRHLSCVETGRARPSQQMVLRLARHLDVPLRERNSLLMAAGYAPVYRERPLEGEEMGAARSAVDMLLRGHEPYPAVVVDRLWNMVRANRAMDVLLGVAPPELLAGEPNVMRLALHPQGLPAHAVGYGEVRAYLLGGLLQQVRTTGDPRLRALYDEVSAYEVPAGEAPAPLREHVPSEAVVPIRFRTPHGELALFSTIATFGAPADVTLSELAIELFFPLDEHTARVLRAQADAPAPPGGTADLPAEPAGRTGR
ncbi:helix-turn-helix domain-containing protein [Streptomyces rimosus]|uniref:helix-turn-helix domain-containing protein n=1 Tax=Streptomyces rimosus TaxID=1927 RepID=UPI0004C623F9|nr:helix-turn-helix transcriptional regulator [Streptomyces rimosus]